MLLFPQNTVTDGILREWEMATKHTCNEGRPPVFGRKTAGCPRCDELLAGAKPVVWRSNDQARLSEVRAHFASHRHLSGGCGPVCTFGEW